MAILADCHTHSHFSPDSQEGTEQMIQAAIDRNLTHICLTEHMDLDYQVTEEYPPGRFVLDVDAYYRELLPLQQQYADKIEVGFGIELGMQPHLNEENTRIAQSYPFDFIIASSHMVGGIDPCWLSREQMGQEQNLYRDYFREELECIRSFREYDVYGHIDYVVRYGKEGDGRYAYRDYSELFDEMINIFISRGKGIELNTSGLRKGLREMNPYTDFLKRYRQMGGEIITVGSDAHCARDVAADFDMAAEILRQCGFRYYCVFQNRKPKFRKL